MHAVTKLLWSNKVSWLFHICRTSGLETTTAGHKSEAHFVGVFSNTSVISVWRQRFGMHLRQQDLVPYCSYDTTKHRNAAWKDKMLLLWNSCWQRGNPLPHYPCISCTRALDEWIHPIMEWECSCLYPTCATYQGINCLGIYLPGIQFEVHVFCSRSPSNVFRWEHLAPWKPSFISEVLRRRYVYGNIHFMDKQRCSICCIFDDLIVMVLAAVVISVICMHLALGLIYDGPIRYKTLLDSSFQNTLFKEWNPMTVRPEIAETTMPQGPFPTFWSMSYGLVIVHWLSPFILRDFKTGPRCPYARVDQDLVSWGSVDIAMTWRREIR